MSTPYLLNESEILILLLGLVPFGIFLLLSIARKSYSLVSLTFFSMVVFWSGYHLTPWLSISYGGWSTFMLKRSEVEYGLAYSTAFLFSILIGSLIISRRGPSPHSPTLRSKRFNFFAIAVCLAVASVAIAVLSVGSLEDFLRAPFERGAGQFEEMTTERRIKGILIILASITGTAAVGFASGYVSNRQLSLGLMILITFVALAGSSRMIFSFSRASGGFLILTAFLILVLTPGGRCENYKRTFFGIILVFIGFKMNTYGYSFRWMNPGWLNYVENFFPYLFGTTEGPTIVTEAGIDPNQNMFNALDAFTASVFFTSDRPGFIAGFFHFLMILNPTPSAFLNYDLHPGPYLTEAFGTKGSSNLTTPLLAELTYLMGWGGILVGIGYGALIGFIDRRIAQRDWFYLLPFVMTLGSCVVSLHSGIRATSRPIIYAFVLLLIIWVLRRLSRSLRRRQEFG